MVGKTGSGKSYFAEKLLREYFRKGWNVVIIDIENKIDTFTPYRKQEHATLSKPVKYDPKRGIARATYYVPSLPGYRDETLEQLYQDCLQTSYTVVFHDEIVGIATANQYPLGLLQLYSQGRKKNVAGIVLTQRPVDVPRMIVTQASLVACFRLTDQDDRKIMSKKLGLPALNYDSWKEKYSFFFVNDEMEHGIYHRPV